MKQRHPRISGRLFAVGLALNAVGLTDCSSDDSTAGASGMSGLAGAPTEGGAGGDGHAAGAAGAGSGGGSAGGESSRGGAGGWSASGGASGNGAGGEPASRLERFFSGEFARKVVAAPNETEYLVLLEKAGVLHVDYGHPRRRLVKVSADGEVLPWIATLPWSAPTNDVSLLDFALHPSGETTALFASTAGYHLVRIDPSGEVISETALADPEIPLDAPSLPAEAPSAPIEMHTHDTGRLQAFGEQVVIATRTGRHSVIAYRYDFREAHFEGQMRALVVPPFAMYGVGLTGGSHDTFGQLDAQFSVHVAVDDASTIYVAVQHPHVGGDSLVKAHKRAFNEDLQGDPDALDIYVTRLTPEGGRLGTSVISTPEADELYGLRAGAGVAYIAGRKEYWNESGTGFDALAAEVDGSTGAVQVFELDVHQSDIAFDVAGLSESELLVVGASGYSQNPNGASISEEAEAFAYVLERSGATRALDVPNRTRNNGVRSLTHTADGRWLAVGMLDGPGTHSGDADAGLVRADGFLVDLRAR